MKLRVIIFGLFVGLGGLSFAAFMLYGVWETRPAVVASMRVTMTDLAKSLALSFENEIDELATNGVTRDRAREEASRLGENSSGLETYWLDEEDFDERFADATLLFDRNLKTNPRYGQGKERVLVRDDALVVLYPIEKDGVLVAYVGVERSLELAREIIWRSRWKIAIVGGAIGIAALLASWWLSSRLTHSLERLASYATNVGDGKDARFKPSKSVEVGQLAEALESMRKALEGKEYVEKYTQSLAHALKAPLAGIRASSEILGESPKEADSRLFLGHIQDESERMNAIVERLLRLSSLESGKTKLDSDPVSLRELVEERVAAFAWAKERYGVSIELVSDVFEVVGDSFWLGEAVGELLSNAIEFCPDGSTIRVSIGRKGKLAEISIENEGAPVPEWAISRVEERFYSLPHPRSGKKGTGLGLALVGQVARLHGGRFSLRNRQGGGAIARLELPS